MFGPLAGQGVPRDGHVEDVLGPVGARVIRVEVPDNNNNKKKNDNNNNSNTTTNKNNDNDDSNNSNDK